MQEGQLLGQATRALLIATGASLLGAMVMKFNSKVTPKPEDAKVFGQMVVVFLWGSALSLGAALVTLLLLLVSEIWPR